MNAPVRFQMHTSPFSLLNLAESCTDYNHDGSSVLNFKPQPYRYKRYWEEEKACFAAFGHAASRHMIPVVSLVRTFGEPAFFNLTLFIQGIAGDEYHRDEMIFERTGPSWYSCEVFAALVELSRDAGTTCIAWARGFSELTQGRWGAMGWIAADASRLLGAGEPRNGNLGQWRIWAIADLGNGMSASG